MADSAALPLPFLLLRQTVLSSELALVFDRRLGTEPSTEPPAPTVRTISQSWGSAYHATRDITVCLRDQNHSVHLQISHTPQWLPLKQDSGCLRSVTIAMRDLIGSSAPVFGTFADIGDCLAVRTAAAPPLRHAEGGSYSAAPAVRDCVATRQTAAPFLHEHTAAPQTAVAALVGCTAQAYRGSSKRNQRSAHYSPARDVPCEYYIRLTPAPTVPVVRPCPRFPSHRLPLQFRHYRTESDAAMLPLPFQCYALRTVPILKAYIMLNTITATLDGQALNILSADVSSGMDGFCWQCRLELYPDDFALLNIDGRTAGDEAEIVITINGEAFRFLAEDYSDNREFGKKTYTVQGRSISARLAADYAQVLAGSVDSDWYARQHAEQQLQFLPFEIDEWELDDWFIPAGSVQLSEQTPMSVLTDLATAAGGFVSSHPSQARLSFKPRWRFPAWDIATVTVDAVIPDSVIASISGQKRFEKRYNAVFVWADHEGGKGADVFRQYEDRSSRAATLVHALYTDAPVCRSAGIAALSDTGKHKTETVKLPLSAAYNIPRAEIGDIWQIGEQTQSWRGVITNVAINATIENNGAVAVWQTVTLDRYLDD